MNRFKKTSYLYDWISCVIPDRIYFGPLPNDYMIEQLKEKKFNLIVNLTENTFNTDSIRSIHYPIVDTSIPDDIHEYCKFIINLKQEYENKDNKIYIHCKGGHSRSSMVMVSLLFCIYNKELKDVINNVLECHRKRVNLREIWKYKSPFNYKQFMFLCIIHKNIYINIDSDSKIYNWLSPKNIWIDNCTLDEYVNENKCTEELFGRILENKFLLHRIRNTYLKKLTFVFEDKQVGQFYDDFFKMIREKIV